MKILTKASEIKTVCETAKFKGKRIGFVPTMGALHRGHLSLVEQAKAETDVVVVSIFVNPTQFNNPADLLKYPRRLESDVNMLNELLCENDYVFAPQVSEMYPDEITEKFDFAPLDSVMEGKFRSGHFQGVAVIVSRLFSLVMPDKAFFGEKDFQQLAIVNQLVSKYMPQSGIQIIGCRIFREENGLAMSSRNELLTKQQRSEAGIIYKNLIEIPQLIENKSVSEVVSFITNKINSNPQFSVEYLEIVNSETLMPLSQWNESTKRTACIAVFADSVRLIDNISF